MPRWSPFATRLAKIAADELALLKQVREGWYVDYKSGSIAIKDIAKALSAFANTYGGHLFFGVAEASKENPVAETFPGIPKAEVEVLLQQLRQAASAHLSPTPHFEVTTFWGPCASIGLPTDYAVIGVEIPESHEAPHIHSDGRIFRRVADASEPKAETDRQVLDSLWARQQVTRDILEEWVERSPEFSEAEAQTPYVRLLLDVDPWGNSLPWLDASLSRIRELMVEAAPEGFMSIPFDAVHTTSSGFLARQRAGNDPTTLGLTWSFARSLYGEVLIPLPCYRTDNVMFVGRWLEGYEHAGRFEKLVRRAGVRAIAVADLNSLLHVLRGVCLTQRRLLRLAGAEPTYKFKAQVLNAARVIPFVDAPFVLDAFEAHGMSVSFRNKFSVPFGTDPNSFHELSSTDEGDMGEGIAAILQALNMFRLIAEGWGLPVADPSREGETGTEWTQLDEASRRAARKADRR
jgi:hypothetical protein